MPEVSFYQNAKDKTCTVRDLTEILDEIKSGEYSDEVEACRDALRNDKQDLYKRLKSNLPSFSVAGLFNGAHKLDSLNKYTKFLILDFDNVRDSDDHLPEDKSIREDEYCYAYFYSPSNRGLKIIVKVDSSLEDHSKAFRQVSEYYEDIIHSDVDQSGKDVTRLCFVSYDAELYFNPDATVFNVDAAEEEAVTSSIENIEGDIKSECSELEILESIVTYCEENHVSITQNYDSWYRVALVIANFNCSAKERANYFLRLCRLDGSQHSEKKSLAQIQYSIKNQNGKIGIGTLIHFAKEVGYKLKSNICYENQFWFEIPKSEGESTTYDIKINPSDFLNWLETKGFFLVVSAGKREILKQNGFFIEESSVRDLKTTLLNYVDSLPETVTAHCTKKMLRTSILNNNSRFFTYGFLDFLQGVNVVEHRDTKDAVYFYFANGIVEVSATDVKLIKYDTIKQAVFKSDIINFDIDLSWLGMDRSSGFSQFIRNICPSGKLNQVIGSLLSRYKSPEQGVATILIDEGVSEKDKTASGGRGKSLILEAISRLRTVEIIDGKNICFNKFLFQQISSRTNVIHFDDVLPDFEFEKLYSALTSDLIVEGKGLKPFSIPFASSPKFAISTNYVVKGSGGYSEERRKLVIEISDYYGKHLTPRQEFSFLFFTDFNKQQWNDFYSFMFECVKSYLKRGLPESDSDVEAEKAILLDTSRLFVEFMERISLEKGVEYDAQDLFDLFKEFAPKLSEIHSRTFYMWIRKYCAFKGLTTSKQYETKGEKFFDKRQGVSYFTLK